jgi:hypothetical protein
MRRITLVSALVAGLLASTTMAAATTSPVSATSGAATTIPFEALLVTVEVGEPDREWVSGPIHHVRDLPVSDVWTGGLEGTMQRWVSFDMNLETGHNVARCRTVLQMTGPLDETFTARCRGTLLEGTFNGRSDAGSLLRGTYGLAPGGVPGIGPYEASGTILVPVGRG